MQTKDVLQLVKEVKADTNKRFDRLEDKLDKRFTELDTALRTIPVLDTKLSTVDLRVSKNTVDIASQDAKASKTWRWMLVLLLPLIVGAYSPVRESVSSQFSKKASNTQAYEHESNKNYQHKVNRATQP